MTMRFRSIHSVTVASLYYTSRSERDLRWTCYGKISWRYPLYLILKQLDPSFINLASFILFVILVRVLWSTVLCCRLLPHIKENIGFVFTKADLAEIRDLITGNKVDSSFTAVARPQVHDSAGSRAGESWSLGTCGCQGPAAKYWLGSRKDVVLPSSSDSNEDRQGNHRNLGESSLYRLIVSLNALRPFFLLTASGFRTFRKVYAML